jgi:predicted DNA binding CopG/RHH family protein
MNSKDGSKMFSTRLPESLIKRMKTYCIDKDLTMQKFLVKIVEEALKAKN